MKIIFRIKGAEEIKRAMMEMDSRQQRVGLIKTCKAMSEPVLAAIKAASPYDPESQYRKHLRESFMTKFTRRGTRRATQSVGPDTKADDRARFIELGTIHITPDPFMEPALQENIDVATAAGGARMWEVTVEGLK